ncbi:ShlB/FhaC/HecB family hemolysin secretion/activation protein [Chroococcidiopsis sp. CCMEE 29]|uniref:ShlB/FhaC/HecB family hemolysin secretion/activation protein n=1 Tax=Chroococcidiopsis sp. CCMEE 29 TaxID=155894 RepID=UPI002020C6B0|nr:ShlB/FhaC/HecB family hemolysin secretion/activation protein [Chroococcidiopsis sp. CCMEE 29]
MGHSLLQSFCIRQPWFQLILVVLTNTMTAGSLRAQTIDPIQVSNLSNPISQLPPTPPPQDVIPPAEPTPPVLPRPAPLPPPEELLSPPTIPTTPEPVPGKIPEKIRVKRFEVVGSTVFSTADLDQVLAPFTNRSLSFAELFQARSAVTQLYIERGYITSGALIPPQTIQDGVVKIQVVEGVLEAINVTGTRRLNPDYVRDRLPTSKPLNQQRLLEALQLLQLNPLIQNLSAELAAGARPGTSVLEVRVTEAQTFSTQLVADNGRSPSVGSFRRRLQVNEANLLGQGDGLSLAYSNTQGSNGIDANYTFPINARNGTLGFSAGFTDSSVIEPPFDFLDIDGNSRYYELTLRQPVVQTPAQEFILGLTAARRESNISSSVLEDFGYPPSLLSPGADQEGRTRISALQFFQEWTARNSREVIAARSQFNLGVGAFNATINEDDPDSRFFSWRGQAQWVRLLATNTLLLLRTDVQLADSALVPLEQFGLGGQESVRGYRQDALLKDNGALISAELRLPIYRSPEQQLLLQLTPFVDVGTVWNSSGRAESDTNTSDTNTLASVGLGLRCQLGDSLIARLDWGIPLVDITSRERTWQENGVYFSVIYNPF